MSIVNIKTNEYGDPITVNNPNQTITNIQNLSGNIGADNFRLRGLEVRNFKKESVTDNISTKSKTFSVYPGAPTGIPTVNMLDWFSSNYRYIGPFDAARGDILVELSFQFRVVSTVGGTDLASVRYPDLYFEIYTADNTLGQNLTYLEGTRRRYSSNRGDGNIRVAGSCTIVVAHEKDVTQKGNDLYFYLGIRDMNFPNSNDSNFSTYELIIADMTFMGRTYKR
jgi:hypothetical protein